MKGFIRSVATLAVVFIGLYFLSPNNSPLGISVENSDVFANAYRDRISDIQVSDQGVVIRTLPDDRDGYRHQRFILELSSGQTLLISHNIDLAPRIPSLKSGDTVQFKGEYEWNEQGGVIHWTHHDPNGSHEGGWLKHNGRTYQ
jgi:hypothetical protein